MTKIVNVEAYSNKEHRYVHCEVEVDMEAFGVAGWSIKSIGGLDLLFPDTPIPAYKAFGIDPITYDQVDAAARVQIRGEQ
jgi:hypothetical protein